MEEEEEEGETEDACRRTPSTLVSPTFNFHLWVPRLTILGRRRLLLGPRPALRCFCRADHQLEPLRQRWMHELADRAAALREEVNVERYHYYGIKLLGSRWSIVNATPITCLYFSCCVLLPDVGVQLISYWTKSLCAAYDPAFLSIVGSHVRYGPFQGTYYG